MMEVPPEAVRLTTIGGHRMKQSLVRTVLALVLVTGIAAPAAAQIEVGASLVNVTFLFEDGDNATLFGIPSSPFGVFTPGVYASKFLTQKIAVEGNLGLAVISGEGETAHLLNLGGQVDWFMNGEAESSPYVFGGLGVLHATDAGSTATVSFGAGYRKLFGDRLTMRFIGRFTKITDDGGNIFDIGVTIGGIFGR
jgi:hypothetical protein